MKLSTAIRLGAMMGPQSDHYFNGGDYENPVAFCALGGACLAAGFKRRHDGELVWNFYYRQWPWMEDAIVKSPVDDRACEVWKLIGRLNGVEKWTREAIATWVATIEPQETEPVTVNDVTTMEVGA